MEIAFTDLLKQFSKEEQQKLAELEKQVIAGFTNAVKAGEAAFHIRILLSKPGVKGGLSAYLRDRKIVRQTFYNWIAEYQWSRVPAALKAKAEGHSDSAAVRKLLIAQAEAKEDEQKTDEELTAAITEAVAERKASDEDPIVAAVKKASDILVAAFKGDLNKVVNLVDCDEMEIAKGRLQMLAANLMSIPQLVAQQTFNEMEKAVKAEKSLASKKLKLPESVAISQPRA